VAAATEDTPVAEGEDFDRVRSAKKIAVGRIMSRTTIQCDDGFVEAWKQRGAP
jgi:hypothetical protein